MGSVWRLAGASLPEHGAVAFELGPGETRVFEVAAGPREYVSVSARGERATLTCTLRTPGGAAAVVGSLGGTGGSATVAAVADEASTFEFEVKRGGKEAGAHAVSAMLAVRRPASSRDRLEAQAFRAFAEAKTAAAMDVAFQDAMEAESTGLAASIAMAEGRALYAEGKYQAGLDFAAARLPLAKALNDTRVTAQLLYVAGLCEIALEKNREAAGRFAEALGYQRAADQPYEVAATLNNLSAAHMVVGDCRESLAEAEEALAIRRTLGDEARVAFSMLSVAKAHLCLGDEQQALDTYGAVIPLWRRLKDARNEAAALNDVGVIDASLGALNEARASYESALRLREASRDFAGQGESLVNLGQVHLLAHEYAGALATYDRALRLPPEARSQRMNGYAMEGRAEALFHLGRKSESLAALRESVATLHEVGDRSEEAYAWRMLGEVEGSPANYQRAIELAREVGDGPSEAVYLNALAHLERDRGELADARASLEQALPMIESTRADLSNPSLRASYLSASRDAYELYVDVLARMGEAGGEIAAFQASERAHARTLLDEIGARGAPILEPASLEEIRASGLDSGTVLLEYLLGDRRSWLWFVSRDSFERFELPERAVLERSARRLYASLTARGVRNPNESAEQRANRWKQADAETAAEAARLRRMLLRPVESRIGGRRVLLVNDGPLHLIPFAELGVRGEVVLTPSASVLVRLRRVAPKTGVRNTLILADPVFGASDFVRLPQTRNEADGIASLLPRGQVEERTGLDAAPAVLREADAGRFATIHIATHTVLNNRRPELSGIVLSPGGVLRLRDIYNLRLAADLVTLSGCETALGKDVRGEGMIGLSYAFLYAGARRVVASLWKVEDSATGEFMKSFYRNMIRERLAPAAALHAAQAEMRRDPRWSAPYYWAAFTIEGDWR